MEIKFNSDDNLPLNKILKLHNMTIVIRSAFQEDGKYPQVFLDECLYEVYILGYDRIDISEGIRQMHQKNVTFVIIGILKILFLSMNYIFAMVVMI